MRSPQASGLSTHLISLVTPKLITVLKEDKMNLNFMPDIEGNNEVWTLTAPHKLRDRVWDLCKDIRGNVIWMNGKNATQIEFGAHPGYADHLAFLLVSVRVYIAGSDLSLADFWALSAKEHAVAYSHSFDATETITAEDHIRIRGIELPDASEVKDCIDAWLPKEAIRQLEQQIRDLSHFGYRADVAYGWWQEGLEAYRHLQYVDPDCLFIDKATWESRTNECRLLVSILQSEYEEVTSLNSRMDKIKSTRQDLVENFKTNIDEVGPTETMRDTFVSLLSNFIPGARRMLENLSADYDGSIAKSNLNQIRRITPPAPPKCEK